MEIMKETTPGDMEDREMNEKKLNLEELEQVGGGVIPIPENRPRRPKFSKKEYMEQERKAQQAVNDLLGGGVDMGVQMGVRPDPNSQDGKEDGNA